MQNVKEWRRTPSFPRFEAYIMPWSVLETVRSVSSATLGHNWFGTGKKTPVWGLASTLSFEDREALCLAWKWSVVYLGANYLTRSRGIATLPVPVDAVPRVPLYTFRWKPWISIVIRSVRVAMFVFPWFPLPVPCKVQWILILVNVTTACLICTASPHIFWQSQHILTIIGWRSHWKREGRHCVRIHIVRPSRRGVASSICGVFGCFFFCPLRICIFSFLYLCWFYNLYSVPYVFLFCSVLVFSEFGGLVFGNLVFCCNDFFLVRRYFCLCTWYIFWYFGSFHNCYVIRSILFLVCC